MKYMLLMAHRPAGGPYPIASGGETKSRRTSAFMMKFDPVRLSSDVGEIVVGRADGSPDPAGPTWIVRLGARVSR